MANITVPRDAQFTLGVKEFHDPVAAATKLIKGAMYGLNASGYAVNMESGVAATARGEVLATVDNTDGDAGDLHVDGRSGCFRLHILGSSALVHADAGAVVYFQDNQTVAKSSNGGARPVAGRLIDVRASMAEVMVGPSSMVASPDGDLVAANDLSDVADPATARANIGANKGCFVVPLPSLLAGTYRCPLPEGQTVTITRLAVVVDQALGGADLTATCSINTTAITDGVVTVTQAGSAAGSQGEAAPSALNVSDGANDLLRVVLAGNTSAGTGSLLVEFTY